MGPLLVSILCFPFLLCSDDQWNGFAVPQSDKPVVIERFQYDMRGSVRLLFFWVGKSGVGGGWIHRIRPTGDQSTTWFDGWEVLFGSKPEAVPGGHNRWGYARELAYWDSDVNNSPGPTLRKTVFEGFMTLSDEDSLSEVRKEGEDETLGGAAFEGTESSVQPENSSVEIRRFLAPSDASFENPAGIVRQYLDLRRSTPPHEARELTHPAPHKPYGFLTIVHACLSDVVGAGGNRELWKQLQRQKRSYVYNARPYSLAITKIKHHSKVELGDDLSLNDVLEVDFETRREGVEGSHDFSVWTTSTGPLAGIPVKIVDKPRWWLKVELTLQDSKPTETVVLTRAR